MFALFSLAFASLVILSLKSQVPNPQFDPSFVGDKIKLFKLFVHELFRESIMSAQSNQNLVDAIRILLAQNRPIQPQPFLACFLPLRLHYYDSLPSAVVAWTRCLIFAAAAAKNGEGGGARRAFCFESYRKRRERAGPPAACRQRQSSGG